MNIPIEPSVVVREPLVFTSVIVEVTAIDLGQSASIRVSYYTAEYSCLKVEELVLRQPEYSQWGSDDEFIIDWSLSQLGLKKA